MTFPSCKSRHLVDDEDEWDALSEAEGRVGGKGKEKDHKQTDGMDPVLEELPKWTLLFYYEENIGQQTIAKNRQLLV